MAAFGRSLQGQLGTQRTNAAPNAQICLKIVLYRGWVVEVIKGAGTEGRGLNRRPGGSEDFLPEPALDTIYGIGRSARRCPTSRGEAASRQGVRVFPGKGFAAIDGQTQPGALLLYPDVEPVAMKSAGPVLALQLALLRGAGPDPSAPPPLPAQQPVRVLFHRRR